MADLQTVKIRDLIETTQVMTTDYLVLEKDTGTFKCQARYLKGATGLTPNVQVGNTTTLAPGQLATVTQRGNTENPIFDFGIPQGVQGQIGPQGPKGDTPDITPLQTQIDNRFNALTSQQQGSSEVIEARGGYPALKARLDAINDDLIKYNDQTIVTHTTESNFSSISATKNGYLDNILLEGKTLVVDANNNVVIPGTQGATLKSVGDDVTEIKLNSINKNLANEIVMGSVGSSGEMIPSNNSNRLNKTMVQPNTQYIFSKDNRTRNCNKYFYNKNGDFIGQDTISGSNPIFTTTNDTNYVVLTWGSSLEVGDYQLEKGNSRTDYIDNKDNTKKVLYKDTDGTWKKPNLRQWDSIEKHSDGKYYYHKRSIEKILNGTESWSLVSSLTMNNTMFFSLDTGDIKNNNDILAIKSDKFGTIQMSNLDQEGIRNNNLVQIRILKSKLSTQDLQGFKNWLNLNNVNVVYPLKNEQVFECTPIDLISYDTQTNYGIECGPIYPKTTLKVNSYLGNVVGILKDKVSNLEDMFKLVVAGNMQELAYQLYPQDFVVSVDKEVIE